MATSRYTTTDRGRQMASPRPKTRDNKETPCRNILIYGHCRYEDQGCSFNHDQGKGPANSMDTMKKSLNVDSPSFTPAQLQSGAKKHTFSSQTVNAAVFTPKAIAGSATPVLSAESESPFINPATIREFTPQPQPPNYEINTAASSNGVSNDSGNGVFEAFNMASIGPALAPPPFNPYADDHTSLSGAGGPFFQAQNAYAPSIQPLQYHLYAPTGPHKSDLAYPFQRQAHDFFLPNDIREDLQKKAAATRQVLNNSQLPEVSQYHSLVPLDSVKNNHSSIFGSSVCWVYKATSKKNGQTYCLRRLQGARVTSKDSTNGPLNKWRRVSNGSVVSVIEVFTSREFNDTSLIFIHNYHPNSKTLAEQHLSSHRRFGPTAVPESVLWSYISQLCNALMNIHNEGLAARCIHPTKVILTEKNRIRLSACMILDVLEYESSRPISDLQQEDLVDLGKLILGLAIGVTHINSIQTAVEQFSRMSAYSAEIKELVYWLVAPPHLDQPVQKSVLDLARATTHRMFESFDSSLQAYDGMNSNLHQELENGRIARLLLKLGAINERPEFDNDPNWSENGERYTLKLFRDYVFHQVDTNGTPVLDLGHMLACLNKLDAGVDEKVYLTSRDHQTSFVISYKELKKQVANSFQELQKAGQTKTAAPRSGY